MTLRRFYVEMEQDIGNLKHPPVAVNDLRLDSDISSTPPVIFRGVKKCKM